MSIAPIGPVGPSATNAAATPLTSSTGSASGAPGFASALGGAVDDLQQAQATSDQLNIKAVTGGLDDIHDATIAATRAQVTLELFSTVRNKAVDAFNEIMRMQA
jgi:flagellar hook-basal body complex protein FliE